MKNVSINWGNPKGNDYDIILDYFSATKINSIKTSSVPLAQYWKNYQHGISLISDKLGIGETNASMYFEYPTKSYSKNKSSMTDLMILLGSEKIAIEAKYTEYEKTVYESINTWYNKNKSENRLNVLQHWNNIISNYSSGEINETSELPYQFFHRTASACYNNTNNAYVIYQLFWDSKTKGKLKIFEEEIRNYVNIIKPKSSLKYLLHKVEVINIDKVEKINVFQEIKYKNVYEFGSEKIEFA